MLSPSIHPFLFPRSPYPTVPGWYIFGSVVSRNRLLWMARSLGLIKNCKSESEVHSPFLPFLYSPCLCAVLAGYGGGGGGTVRQMYSNCAWQSPQAVTRCTGLQRRKIRVKPDRERTCLFFFFILCNDNDIIDMNNAMSANIPPPFFFFFLLLFHNPVIFTPPENRNVPSSSSLYCENITIRDIRSFFQLH